MNSAQPLVSVVLAVYNGEQYLAQAIQSVLNQTYKNFEFFIVDDGSTDGSLQIIQSFRDERIQIISRENKGLVASLNEGIAAANGKYIARMDADDECLPERFEKQVAYLEANDRVGLCGTSFYYVNNNGESKSVWHLNNEELKANFLFTCPILHPTAFMRTSVLRENNLEYGNVRFAQDLDLWYRISLVSNLAVLPDVLLKYRLHDKSISKQHSQEQTESALRTHRQVLKKLCGNSEAKYVAMESKLHFLIFTKPLQFNEVAAIIEILKALIKINNKTKAFNKDAFKKMAALNLYLINYRFGFPFSLKLLWLFLTKGNTLFFSLPADKKMKLVVKCLIQKKNN